MPKALIAAVGYIRMSSGKQEASPAQQRAEIKKLAKREHYKIVRWYIDEGISGDETEKRADFQRMIRDAEEKGDFCAILCWDQDRFGRFDSIEAGRWIHPLRQAGVWLVTVAQGHIDWNDFAGRMMFNIQQEGKHQFLVDLSKNILRGKIEAARRGKGATCPRYGFDRAFYDQDGKLVKRVPYGERFTKPKEWAVRFVLSKDKEAVKTVRWIFGTFADSDCSMTWLAGELNRRGVSSPKGRAWSVQGIEGVLTTRVYTGANVFGETRYGKYHHMGKDREIARGSGRLGKGNPIVVDGVHDQLIDVETFEKCQRKLADRAVTGQKPRYSRYLLSGVLRCGHCGGALTGKSCRSGNLRRYYICTTGNNRPGACRAYHIPQERIEDYVLGVIEDRLLAPDAIDRIRRAIHQRAKAKVSFKGETRSLKAKIEALDQKISKGTENLLLASHEHVADLSDMLAEWKVERQRLQAKLEKAAVCPNGRSAEATARQAVAELERLRNHLKTGDPMRVRGVIKAMVEEIRLWWEPNGKRYRRLARGVMTFAGSVSLLSKGKEATSQKVTLVFQGEDVLGSTPRARAVATLRRLYQGQPVRSVAIADRLGVTPSAVNKALLGAKGDGLVRSLRLRGWVPVPEGSSACKSGLGKILETGCDALPRSAGKG